MSRQNKSILLTGATGQLGRAIIASDLFDNLLTPTRKELDITKESSIRDYFQKNDFDSIIHTAALARMVLCEQDPIEAIKTNILGTANLVKAALEKEAKFNKKIYFVYISTDGVYASTKGNYKETDPTIPYNKYGWTKLAGECAVHLLNQFCIVRTRFFEPDHLKFSSYAVDSYTSSLPIEDCVKALAALYKKCFTGIINVGGERISDFEQMKAIKDGIKPCTVNEILKQSPFQISRDASLDTALWRKMERKG